MQVNLLNRNIPIKLAINGASVFKNHIFQLTYAMKIRVYFFKGKTTSPVGLADESSLTETASILIHPRHLSICLSLLVPSSLPRD